MDGDVSRVREGPPMALGRDSVKDLYPEEVAKGITAREVEEARYIAKDFPLRAFA